MAQSLDREIKDESTTPERREVLEKVTEQARALIQFLAENNIGPADIRDSGGSLLWAPKR